MVRLLDKGLFGSVFLADIVSVYDVLVGGTDITARGVGDKRLQRRDDCGDEFPAAFYKLFMDRWKGDAVLVDRNEKDAREKFEDYKQLASALDTLHRPAVRSGQQC